MSVLSRGTYSLTLARILDTVSWDIFGKRMDEDILVISEKRKVFFADLDGSAAEL